MQVTVLVNGDTTFEPNEAFTVHLSNAIGATISDADGSGTITNDDAAPSFAIDDVTHDEGDAGTTSYTFTVTKTGSTALSASVDYETVNGTAAAPGDFTAIPATTLTFGPSDTTMQVTVPDALRGRLYLPRGTWIDFWIRQSGQLSTSGFTTLTTSG